jgi:hypothetical protein
VRPSLVCRVRSGSPIESSIRAHYSPTLDACSGHICAHSRSQAGRYTASAWQSGGVTKTQYFTATSLDGHIADEDNSLAWLFDVDRGQGDDDSFTRFFAEIGAMAMGATTYEWVLDHEDLLDHPERWHAYYGETPCWVFTHRTLPSIPGADIRFANGDVRPGSSGDDARGGRDEHLARGRR